MSSNHFTPRKFPGFPPTALSFLSELRTHNNRRWFEAHRENYEKCVKAPMVEMILRIGEAFSRFAPEMVADPKISLYRIYRDIRFSPDKSPYKTHVAAVFPVRGLPKNAGPGLYFHVSAEEVLMGGGIYMPDPSLLRAVRVRIAAFPHEFIAIVEGPKFRKAFGELEGEQLKTMPKGFSPEQEGAKYLRYKQFLFGKAFPAQLAASPRLLPAVLDCFEQGMPVIRFLKEAVPKGLWPPVSGLR